jgi:hypothetical protein
MALRMVALGRAKDGRWFARKAIPQDVREDYARLFGVRREAQLKLPADKPRPVAKVQLGEWTAEIETRILGFIQTEFWNPCDSVLHTSANCRQL